jgi:hypothetical protein
MRSSEHFVASFVGYKSNNIIAAMRNEAARTCCCLVYIDLNMVRARVVTHPHSGHQRLSRDSESPEAIRDYRSTGVKFYVALVKLPNFSKRTAEAVVAAFALENSRILSWNDLN